MITKARLARIDLPMLPRPDTAPELPAALYPARVERLRKRAGVRGYDTLVIYADREHSANLAYLTGFDPRFEEAILILSLTGLPMLLVGNECYGMAGAAPLAVERVLFQELSLPSQPRDRSKPLGEILSAAGVGPGSRVGVVGWKTPRDRSWMEAPAFLVDSLRSMVGPSGLVENATDLLAAAADGLRIINEPEQIAVFEHAACETSTGSPEPPVRVAPGDARARGGPAPGMERRSPVMPPDAHRRTAGAGTA